MHTTTTALGLVAALAAPAAAFFRMPCPGRILTERADPIVSPGSASGHVHTISGGNGFDFTMDYDQARASTCSSCPVKADLSNYWTPKLYYQYQNGSFEDVPQAGDGTGVYGGMTVYYLQRPGPNNDKLHAFPEGFRMLAGDPFKRSGTDDFESKAISFVCLDYSGSSPQTSGMPTKNCPDGLRAQVFFPSCWDGVNLDSADHKSHMAYPIGAVDSGSCPSTHPVHMVSIFFEVIYSVDKFSDMWYGSGQPFVFAQGDPTGYGFHGDFVNGWDVDILQSAIETCTDDSGNLSDCPMLELFTTKESQSCVVPPRIDEAVTGVLDALPGCNPVTKGPGEASPVTTCAVPSIGDYQQYFTDVTGSLGYEYVGCGSDSYSSRTLSSASENLGSMTVETCVKFCSDKGYTYAGLEYASECYCGNSIPDGRGPVDGVLGNCFTPCKGDASEICGGGSALSLYKKCDGTCSNAVYSGPSGSGSSSSSGSSSAASSAAASSSATTSTTSGSASTSTTSKSASISTSVTKATTTTTTSTSGTKTSTSAATTSTKAARRKQKSWTARQRARLAEAEAEREAAKRQEGEVAATLAKQ